MKLKTIIFDFDGVVLDSASIKTRAFAKCYDDEPEDLVRRVVAYQEQHGGIGRREKFEYFEQQIFGRTPDPVRINALCDRFSDIIRQDMDAADYVPGAIDALHKAKGLVSLHLVSGMLETELLEILDRRRISHFFNSVAGAPKKKIVEFRRILETEAVGPGDALAVGDSPTEYEAARDLGIPFLAIIADYAPDFFPQDVSRRRNLCDFDDVLLAFS